MNKQLLFEYDRVGDTLFIGICKPRIDHETDEIADSVIAKINAGSRVVECLSIMYLTAQMTSTTPMQLEI